MPFTVADFPDLLRLLGEHPEWQAALRRHILTDELLAVPGRLDRVEAALEQLTVRVDQLTARLEELTVRVDALAAAQARTEQRLDQLAAAQARTEQRLAELAVAVAHLLEAQTRGEERLQRLEVHVGDLRGAVLEMRYRDRAGAYFAPIARRVRVLDSSALADLVDAAVEAQELDERDRTPLLAADLVLTGRRRADQAEVYLVVEVSAGVGPGDVERAAERASLLARLGRPAIPVVAGAAITADAATLARTQGVWQVLDGQVTPPSDA